MPCDYREYHPKWKLISRLVRRRERNRCKWCGLVNHSVIMRLRVGWRSPSAAEWDMIHSDVRHGRYSMAGSLKRHGFTRVVLTVAHLDHNKANNRFDNLAALCQKCHLGHDMADHVNNRKYGRNWRMDQLKLNF